MKKQVKISLGVLVLMMLLICNPGAWAQSGNAAGTGTLGTANSVSKQKQSSALIESKKVNRQTPDEVSNLQMSLMEARQTLKNGQANHSLNEKQAYVLTEKIKSIESQLKSGSVKTDASAAQAGQAGSMRSIMKEKQFTRAQFAALPLDQKREVLKSNDVVCKDLVNAPSTPLQRTKSVYYITEDNFKNSDVMKRIHVLENPGTYIIVKNGTVLPKQQISRAELNSMPEARQRYILSSDKYEVTN
jgi:hypothetical protein